MASLAGKLLRLDLYPKTHEEFHERTLGGAAISLVSIVFALTLFLSEWSSFRAVETVDKLDVDT